MTQPRFFLPSQPLPEGESVQVEGDLAHRIGRVLRLREGDRISLLNGDGGEAEAELLSLTSNVVTVKVIRRYHPKTEPPLRLSLYQALIAADRFEWVLEKGTELGVSRFVPVLCARSTTRPPSSAARLRHKMQRWQAIVQAAAEQSHRVRLPVVEEPMRFDLALPAAPRPTILAWEQSPHPLSALMAAPEVREAAELSIFIGPEGGFTEEEANLAAETGARIVSLGPRVLRSETASLLLATLALYTRGGFEANAPTSST